MKSLGDILKIRSFDNMLGKIEALMTLMASNHDGNIDGFDIPGCFQYPGIIWISLDDIRGSTTLDDARREYPSIASRIISPDNIRAHGLCAGAQGPSWAVP